MGNPSRIENISPLALLGAEPPPRPKGPVRFCFDDTPERERPTLLRECFARFGVYAEFSAPRDARFHVDLAINAFPGLVLALGGVHASSKRGARELASEMRDDAALVVSLKGAHRVKHKTRELLLGEGEAAFTSCSDHLTLVHGGTSEVLALRFPKAGIAPLVDGLDDRWARPIASDLPALRLLRGYLTLAWDKQALAGPDLQRALATHAYDLMAVMMGATRDAAATAQERGMQAARLHAVKQDIERDLARQDLSAATLAPRHRCTARSIQRMFEAEGTTFSGYVLAQRLVRAYRLLGDPRRWSEKIGAVALDCGFGDLSHFNRAFRRRYGVAPSDVRANARRDGGRH